MAKLRYLIHSRPSTTPYSLALCTACSLFLNASTPEALAQNENLSPINALPEAPMMTSRSIPTKANTSQSAVGKRTIGKKRVVPRRVALTKTTTVKTSGASRVAAHRAGSLYAIAPEKSTHSRAAIATLASAQIGAAQIETAAPVEADSKTNLLEVAPVNAAQEVSTPATSNIADKPASVETAPETELETKPEPARLAAAVAANKAEETSSGPAQPVTGTFQVPAQSPAQSPAAPTTTTTEGASPTANTADTASTPVTAPGDENAPKDPQAARLYAPRISYDRGTIIAEGDDTTPVRLESPQARIFAKKVVLDTVGKTVKAEGSVRVEREIVANRFNTFRPTDLPTSEYNKETITETLQGENFEYNFGTRQGSLGKTRVRLENFNITAEQLVINGQRYIARNVVIRPGGLSDEELKIYGTPPFNLRAREVIVDRSRRAPARDVAADTAESDTKSQGAATPRTEVRGASLYFRNLRLLPVPSALLRGGGSGQREEATFQLTPRAYFNSADGLLLTARLEFPIVRPSATQEKSSNDLSLNFVSDVGISTRVGFRGGAELEADSRYGNLSLGARINDVISEQLTDRIELDRLPELQYSSPVIRLFGLPGARAAGFRISLVAGDYRENFTNQRRSVQDTRLQGQIRFTTLMGRKDGPYLELFARSARYGDHPENLNTQGFEVGYIGRLGSRLNGQVSFSAQNINGSTPFRFDRVEIRRELRTTFDVLLTPRWIVPIDLRYDVDEKVLRDKTFGLLRNYKTFAYGLKYQTSRRELRLEIRQGF